MPIYEYRCTKCEFEFEEMAPMSAPLPPCPTCGAATERLISQVAFGHKRKVSKKAIEMDAKRATEREAERKKLKADSEKR